MSDNPTYYEVLGVDPTAPMTEIVSRYHYLRNVYSEHNMRYSDSRYQALNDAYRVLSNTRSRETYDDELREQGVYPHYEVINSTTPDATPKSRYLRIDIIEIVEAIGVVIFLFFLSVWSVTFISNIQTQPSTDNTNSNFLSPNTTSMSPTNTLISTPTSLPNEILDLGNQAFQRGDYNGAIHYYTELIRREGIDSEVIYLLRAKSYQYLALSTVQINSPDLNSPAYSQNYVNRTIDDYLMVLTINPENSVVYRERGLFYYELCLREITEYCTLANDDLTEYQSRIDESDSEVTNALNDLETLLE